MDVRGVSGSPGPEALSALRGAAAPKPATAAPGGLGADAVASLIGELAASDIAGLLAKIEPIPTADHALQVQNLLQTAFEAAAKGDTPRALSTLAELAPLDPRRAESLESEPALGRIRGEVAALLSRLTAAAGLDAGAHLERALELLRTGAPDRAPAEGPRPDTAALTAGRLIDAGGYANFIRAGQLSQLVIDWCGLPPLPVTLPGPKRTAAPEQHFDAPRRQIPPTLRKLWRRAPLLVLLLGWLAVGLAGGLFYAGLRAVIPEAVPKPADAAGFGFWGMGFLALVGFGFYARVRNVRW
jgi:hypothetical protein